MDGEEQMTDIKKRKRSAENQAVSYRNYRRARERALTKLAQAYPDEYKALLELEKLRDEQTGAKWINITGATLADAVTTAIVEGESGDIADLIYDRANKGNDGGEE
jgi:hypothetical protein